MSKKKKKKSPIDLFNMGFSAGKAAAEKDAVNKKPVKSNYWLTSFKLKNGKNKKPLTSQELFNLGAIFLEQGKEQFKKFLDTYVTTQSGLPIEEGRKKSARKIRVEQKTTPKRAKGRARGAKAKGKSSNS